VAAAPAATPGLGTVSALSFDGVAVRLGGRPVLAGVDLALGEGELLGVLGRNGAGKTTLLRVATGVVAAHAGEVRLGGRPLATFPRRELAREVAIVPQETGVPFPFSVTELVLMARAPHLGLLGFETAADRRAAGAALERLGIAQLADRSVLEISGGERQLAVVARALAQDTRVLLLDEPTAHLDLERRLALLELSRDLVREGRSVLVVSHDLSLAARFCDRVALLAHGRVAALGEPDAILTPARLREVFGVESEILRASDGGPVVVPTATL
jgi:iron complex transport system ATP-binding protein